MYGRAELLETCQRGGLSHSGRHRPRRRRWPQDDCGRVRRTLGASRRRSARLRSRTGSHRLLATPDDARGGSVGGSTLPAGRRTESHHPRIRPTRSEFHRAPDRAESCNRGGFLARRKPWRFLPTARNRNTSARPRRQARWQRLFAGCRPLGTSSPRPQVANAGGSTTPQEPQESRRGRATPTAR